MTANLKQPKLIRCPEYLRMVHFLPCCICKAFGFIQTSITEAHHTFCERFGSFRTEDQKAIPLCQCHHQGLRFDRDKSKLAIHQGKEAWIAEYGNDFDYIAPTQDAIERLAA